LERKYADILVDEDITGVHIEKKKKMTRLKDLHFDDTLDKTMGSNNKTTTTKNKSDTQSTSFNNSTKKDLNTIKEEEENIEVKKVRVYQKAKLDSRNKFYEDNLKERNLKKETSSRIIWK